MNSFTPEEQRMVDYLLGRLSEAERQALTEQFLDNDDVYRAILAMEETLVDAYARGDLPPEDARLVESRLLQTEAGLAKLRTTRALAGRHAREQHRMRRGWLAVAAALVVACGVGLGIAYRRPHRAETPAAAIVLSLSATRGSADVPSARIPPSGTAVFAVPLPDADHAADYEVRLRTPDAKELVRPGHESGNFLRFDVDSASLPPGRYEIEITGLDPGGRHLIAFGAVNLVP
jgi:hypothetical protein